MADTGSLGVRRAQQGGLVAHRDLSQVSMALINGNDHGPGGPVGAGPPALEDALASAGKSTT